jgi:hypothetical protein
VTDHAWPQNLDSVDACEPITLNVLRPSEHCVALRTTLVGRNRGRL